MSVTTYTTVNGQILCQSKDGVVSHFVSDPLGSVVMVRDNSGNTVYEAEYDPYGNVESETGTNPSEFGYVGTLGYVKDSASSLYVRARYLLTNLGRWLTKDPLWPSEPGFVYAGADSIGFVDPVGLQRIRPRPVQPPRPIIYGPPVRQGRPGHVRGQGFEGPPVPPRLWPVTPVPGPHPYDFLPLPEAGQFPRYDPVVCAAGTTVDPCD